MTSASFSETWEPKYQSFVIGYAQAVGGATCTARERPATHLPFRNYCASIDSLAPIANIGFTQEIR